LIATPNTALEGLKTLIADRTGRRYVRLVGRGTSALYVALRALVLGDGPGSAILPDLICVSVLEAVLLAGLRPVFADVNADRFNPDSHSVGRVLGPDTRAVIAAHVFGCVTPPPEVEVPIIEDAVQGLGGSMHGRSVGCLGSISVLSFHPTKMIPGFGGAVLTDDSNLWALIQRVSLEKAGEPYQTGVYAGVRPQLEAQRHRLLKDFEADPANIAAIRAGWERLSEEVEARNRKARYLSQSLLEDPHLGLDLPTLYPGDAIWRYPFLAPSRAAAAWIHRRLQAAGLPGSRPYPSLSAIYDPQPAYQSPELASRLVNLWVDSGVSFVQLEAILAQIRALPLMKG